MKTKNCRYPLFLTFGLIMLTLWSVPSLQAATNIKVSGVMPPFGDVDSFLISPNGRGLFILFSGSEHGWSV